MAIRSRFTDETATPSSRPKAGRDRFEKVDRMMVSWDDLGRPAQTGDYDFRHILVHVDQDAISIWRAEPGAVFHVEAQAPSAGVGVFVLGQWEMPSGTEGEH